MLVTYMVLWAAKIVLARIGPQGIDAATRIVGFFVSAMGMGLIFHGVIEALQTYGLATGHSDWIEAAITARPTIIDVGRNGFAERGV